MKYSDVLMQVRHGAYKRDRTGVGCFSAFGAHMEYNLATGNFPLITERRLWWKGPIMELVWFLSGSTNWEDLPDSLRHWWEPFSQDPFTGELGPIYGKKFKGDGWNLNSVVNSIIENPNSRRHLITTWGKDIEQCALPCCHGTAIQFHVEDNELHLQTYQRSADVILGLPNNLVQYGALLLLVAHLTGYRPGRLYYSLGDAHIYDYDSHLAAADKMLYESEYFEPPTVYLKDTDKLNSLSDFSIDNFVVEDYYANEAISGMEMAV